MFENLTIADLEIDKSEGTYGPVWVVSLPDEKYPQYVLRSDEKMDKTPYKGKVRHGVHLAICYHGDPMRSTDYKGIYETTDMEEAVRDLLRDLVENEKLEKIEREIHPLAMEISGSIDDLSDALGSFPREGLGRVMDNIEIAYVALRMRYADMIKEVGYEH